jgi:hypothetical protein
MNKDDPTMEDDLREEYDLKNLKVRKLGSERTIFDRITAPFRRSSNDSSQKAQKIENQILARINDSEIICKVFLDKDNDVEIFFERKTKSDIEIKDIYLHEALDITRKNTQEHQDINVFLRDHSGKCRPLFLLKEEIDLHNSMQEILSFYPRSLFNKHSKFNRERAINFLRGRQAAKQLTHLYGKEKLQQKKFILETKINSGVASVTVISLFLTIVSIAFVGYPGSPESSIIAIMFPNPSVDYKTCDIKTDERTPEKKGKDKVCALNQLSFQIIFLSYLIAQMLIAYYNLQNKRDLLIINHALDIFPDKLAENDES